MFLTFFPSVVSIFRQLLFFSRFPFHYRFFFVFLDYLSYFSLCFDSSFLFGDFCSKFLFCSVLFRFPPPKLFSCGYFFIHTSVLCIVVEHLPQAQHSAMSPVQSSKASTGRSGCGNASKQTLSARASVSSNIYSSLALSKRTRQSRRAILDRG